ncbi:MAG: hypothetical protein HRT61_20695 [Ekhidna sp.]|nr:hypothetical protein [Ekhidna sp.]
MKEDKVIVTGNKTQKVFKIGEILSVIPACDSNNYKVRRTDGRGWDWINRLDAEPLEGWEQQVRVLNQRISLIEDYLGLNTTERLVLSEEQKEEILELINGFNPRKR